MGDRYELVSDCAYCGKTKEDVWYAPTCSSLTFKCEKCGKENFITENFDIKKIEDVEYEDVYDAINSASNMMDEKQIVRMSKELFKKIRRKDNGKK